MPFNGNGTFVRVYNWTQDLNNNVPITASRFDTEDSGFATGLSTCITKDGQTTLTANIPFNSKKITNLGVGNARTDSLNIGQVQDNQFLDLGTTGGSADAYTAGASPTITSYVATMRYTAKINATNATTTPYLQLNGIADPSTNAVIKKESASGGEIDVVVGDLVEDNIYDFKRNAANDAWIVLNPQYSTKSFKDANLDNLTVNRTINGAVFGNLPTIANNGSDANNDIDFSAGAVFDLTNNVGWAMSALIKRLDASWAAGTNQGGLDTGSKANNTWYYAYAIYNPTTNTADAIFTATYGSPTLPSGYTRSAYIGAFFTDGSSNITAGLFSQNYRFISGQQTITTNGSLTLAHKLGKEPLIIQAILECISAELGFSVGDKLAVNINLSDHGSLNAGGAAITYDSTNIYVKYADSASVYEIQDKTGSYNTITNASWKLWIKAFA